MTAVGRFSRLPTGAAHIDALMAPLEALYAETDRITRWGERLAVVLGDGGRLLALGNGGSACQAQHLTSELVGRYRDARQVQGHGRPGDVLVALSTSGRSPNVLAAVEAAQETGLHVLALTGRPGNPLAEAADDAVCVDSPHTATVQEVHQVAVHLLCAAFEEALACRG
jgi:D-sedoheptulose 7-phosphate isomerase